MFCRMRRKRNPTVITLHTTSIDTFLFLLIPATAPAWKTKSFFLSQKMRAQLEIKSFKRFECRSDEMSVTSLTGKKSVQAFAFKRRRRKRLKPFSSRRFARMLVIRKSLKSYLMWFVLWYFYLIAFQNFSPEKKGIVLCVSSTLFSRFASLSPSLRSAEYIRKKIVINSISSQHKTDLHRWCVMHVLYWSGAKRDAKTRTHDITHCFKDEYGDTDVWWSIDLKLNSSWKIWASLFVMSTHAQIFPSKDQQNLLTHLKTL
jgi:hypothetical protein